MEWGGRGRSWDHFLAEGSTYIECSGNNKDTGVVRREGVQGEYSDVSRYQRQAATRQHGAYLTAV